MPRIALLQTTASQTPAEVLAELDALASAGKWAEAEKALKRVRDNPPDWAAASLDLRTREVRIRLGLDQRPLALATLKELVLKSGAPRSAAFALVREMSSRGERESALLLAREIVRLLPGDAAAARLVQEVEAAKSAGP